MKGRKKIKLFAVALILISTAAFTGKSNRETLAVPEPHPSVVSSSPPTVKATAPSVATSEDLIHQWCEEVSHAVTQLNWKIEPCSGIPWKVKGKSVQGRSLVYAEFGDVRAENTTLILSTVHGDEITPLYLALQLARWVKEREAQLIKTRVVIAPLVNPDGFFSKPRTRMNGHGVDINRNFDTQDWNERALNAWKKRYKKDPRRFPGNNPRSEPETLFQEELITISNPQKILSIHSPLNFLDYDGPTAVSLTRFPREYTTECEKLKKRLNAISSGFFPGSLGNYAGHELGIPTLTLELPSANPKMAEVYWKKFSTGIQTMIHFSVPKYAIRTGDKTGS